MNYLEAKEALDGILLSDGSLRKKGRNAYFKLSQSGDEHSDWLNYSRIVLLTLGVYVSPEQPKCSEAISPAGKPYKYWWLISRTSPLLTLEYFRWYGSGRKEVPEDFRLTPVSLANEFIGDGSSVWYRTGVYVYLYTDGFSLHSIEILERELGKLNISTSRGHVRLKGRVGVVLCVRQSSVNAFMLIVRDLVSRIAPSYEYKIKFREDPQPKPELAELFFQKLRYTLGQSDRK